jgi:hypothetical protein
MLVCGMVKRQLIVIVKCVILLFQHVQYKVQIFWTLNFCYSKTSCWCWQGSRTNWPISSGYHTRHRGRAAPLVLKKKKNSNKRKRRNELQHVNNDSKNTTLQLKLVKLFYILYIDIFT